MSHQHTQAAYEIEDLPATEKAVLLAHAHCANAATGICWPKAETISRMTGHSVRTVQSARGELTRRGLLVVHAYPQGGRGRSTEFRVCVFAGGSHLPPRPNAGDPPAPGARISSVETVDNSVENHGVKGAGAAGYALNPADPAQNPRSHGSAKSAAKPPSSTVYDDAQGSGRVGPTGRNIQQEGAQGAREERPSAANVTTPPDLKTGRRAIRSIIDGLEKSSGQSMRPRPKKRST